MRKWDHARGWLQVTLLLAISALVSPILARGDEPKSRRIVLESRGHFVTGSQVTVSPKAVGHVVELLFEEGQKVKAGDLLARLDATEYEAVVRVARAKLRLAEAELVKAREGAANADRAIAEARVEIARAEVELAQNRLDGTAVRAPIDGVVLTKRASLGTWLDPKSAQAPAGVCDLADLRNMEVEVWVAERDLAKIAKGQECVIRVDALPNETLRGRVARAQPIADRARAAVVVRVRLDVASEHLRPEMSAVVQFVAQE